MRLGLVLRLGQRDSINARYLGQLFGGTPCRVFGVVFLSKGGGLAEVPQDPLRIPFRIGSIAQSNERIDDVDVLSRW